MRERSAGKRALEVQRPVPAGAIAKKLIDAAAEVFAQHGYAAARVRDIVLAADVNLASVNYYFGGKDGLYAATLSELAAARAEQSSTESISGTPAERLHCHVLTILQRVIEIQGPLGRI